MTAGHGEFAFGAGLHARGLHKRFGGVQAVRDISFDVPHGGVFAIIGPNGAGKSTLLNLMSGLHQPDEPAAGLNAAEVERLAERFRILRERGITLVLVEHNMDLVMQVADRVLVMDYGEHLFEGAPAEVQTHPAVIAAYLGGG